METWELDFEWLQLRHKIGQSMGRSELPDLQAILFLIGIQELGWWEGKTFSKEEKQDLMHVAVCTLLEPDGYFEFVGRDQDGWPHWNRIRAFEYQGVETQERVLMGKILRYFEAVFEKEK
ncbi:MAG: hypothetical protein IPH94_02475 [Saprospiraceae bacterium]|nr:hypothetical protein [Saprospiraceae bacterium]MBK7220227.1 hypothetical protein [Saprospiraceae bacterium]MBK7787429.1 hypothetical protein [Saprospiraceae bacterium]MBK8109759.1 hypothetical protein [Saprospiraceae bacterium]MBK8849267.1 hypothetical protein [Saprospiraceae bacterium]